MGNTSKFWIINPVKVSMHEGGEGGGLGGGAGSPGLSTHTYEEGPQWIWTDPSTLLVPVGQNAKGFGSHCFATAAVCSLSCLLPFRAPCPSMSLAI